MKSCENRLLKILAKHKFTKISHDKGELKFDECQKKKRIMSVMVNKIPENSIVVKCPKKGPFHQEEQFKVCDYLLFNWVGEREIEVFFFELKKTHNKGNVTYAKTQMQATQSWLQQCVIPQIEGQFKKCKGLKKIHEHHVILFGGGESGMTKNKSTPSFPIYSADEKSVSSWTCPKHKRSGVGWESKFVSLQKTRDREKK